MTQRKKHRSKYAHLITMSFVALLFCFQAMLVMLNSSVVQVVAVAALSMAVGAIVFGFLMFLTWEWRLQVLNIKNLMGEEWSKPGAARAVWVSVLVSAITRRPNQYLRYVESGVFDPAAISAARRNGIDPDLMGAMRLSSAHASY